MLGVATNLAITIWVIATTPLTVYSDICMTPGRRQSLRQLARWALQLLLPVHGTWQLPRSAAVAACRALLAATYWQQPRWLSWLPSREVLAMALLAAGSMGDFGLVSLRGHLITIGMSLAASRLLGETFASLQSLTGECVGLSTSHGRAWARVVGFTFRHMPGERYHCHLPPRSAGVILLHHMLCWITIGHTDYPTRVDPLSFGWLTAVHLLVHKSLQRVLGAHAAQSDAAPVALGPPKLLIAAYTSISCTFWLAAILIATNAAATTILGIFPADDSVPWDTVLLNWLLLALCWEPWAHKARLDRQVWQQGIGSLPQLLRSMPPGQAFAGSWWPVRLLRAGLRGMLALVSAVESSERGCICARMNCLMRHLPCLCNDTL